MSEGEGVSMKSRTELCRTHKVTYPGNEKNKGAKKGKFGIFPMHPVKSRGLFSCAGLLRLSPIKSR